LGEKKKACTCSSGAIERYVGKLSGPLLDRIDLHINVQSIEYDTIKNNDVGSNQSSQNLFEGIKKAIVRQQMRYAAPDMWNAYMQTDLIEKHCQLSVDAELLLKKAFEKLHLSMRGYHKILKIARTIADLADMDIIQTPHIQEAIMYRSFEKITQNMV
jgi:magnesium chelatase family protein